MKVSTKPTSAHIAQPPPPVASLHKQGVPLVTTSSQSNEQGWNVHPSFYPVSTGGSTADLSMATHQERVNANASANGVQTHLQYMGVGITIPAPIPPSAKPSKQKAANSSKKKKKKKRKGTRAKGEPKRPRSAYTLFCKDEYRRLVDGGVTSNNANGSKQHMLPSLMKDISHRWKNISPELREEYKKKSVADRARYDGEMKTFTLRQKEIKASAPPPPKVATPVSNVPASTTTMPSATTTFAPVRPKPIVPSTTLQHPPAQTYRYPMPVVPAFGSHYRQGNSWVQPAVAPTSAFNGLHARYIASTSTHAMTHYPNGSTRPPLLPSHRLPMHPCQWFQPQPLQNPSRPTCVKKKILSIPPPTVL